MDLTPLPLVAASLRTAAARLGRLAMAGILAAASASAQAPQGAAASAPGETRLLLYGGGDSSAPYESLDSEKKPRGFNVDLIEALARAAGRKVEVRLSKWSDTQRLVESGRLDLMTLAYTDERASRYAFLDEVWTIRQAVVFLPGRASYPTGLANLDAERVAVEEGSLAHELLLSLPEVSRPLVLTTRNYTTAIDLLRSGRATAVAGNLLVLQTTLAQLGVGRTHSIIAKATSYRLATAKGRETEMAWVGPALQKLRETGEFSQIVERHLTEPAPSRTAKDYAPVVAIFLGALVLVVGGFLAWNRSLRAQVEARTRQIAEAAAEKERLARALVEREQRMRVLVEQMPAVLLSTDVKLRVTSASGRGLRGLGLEEDMLVGRDAGPLIEELGLGHTALLDRLKRGLEGRSSDAQLQVARRDVEIHIEPLRDAAGAVTGLVGIGIDVTERTRAAKALQESEERYRAFLVRSTEGIWRWEFKKPWPKASTVDEQVNHFLEYGYVAECNDAMARLYGLNKAGELVGRTYAEVRQLRRVPASIEHVRGFIAAGCRSAEWEGRWVDDEGLSRWSANTLVGIVEEDALVRLWSTQQDITPRKQAEADLERAHSLVKATLESTADGILAVDSGGRILAWNDVFASMWNLPRGVVESREDEAALAAVLDQVSDGEGFLSRVRELYAKPDEESLEKIGLKDGRIFERFSRPLGAKDAIEGRVWSFRDVTERERSLREIQDANRLLEIKNAELERFTYTVSHDLKSPLITIRGYLGHLETSAVEGNLERFRADAARIHRAAQKMEDLLRDLLALSRIGRVLNPYEDVPMAAVAQDAADLVRGPLVERGVTLEIESGLPPARGDRQRLVEVMQNLIENAIKFMGEQANPRIRVGMQPRPSGDVFFVSDNGMGIEPRHREKVFDLFEKLTPGTEGTGVGLALVKRVIEAHGGKVWVESDGPGRGSTFCFTLPRAA